MYMRSYIITVHITPTLQNTMLTPLLSRTLPALYSSQPAHFPREPIDPQVTHIYSHIHSLP